VWAAMKAILSLFGISLLGKRIFGYETISSDQDASSIIWNVTCTAPYPSICPAFQGNCARVVMDNAFSLEDITNLHAIAQKGMMNHSLGGPTILDINTGFVRDSNGLENLFVQENSILSPQDFEVYGNIIRELKGLVSSSFGLSVQFTTPTFITRLDGSSSWQPSGEKKKNVSLDLLFLFLS
jgi:hypothetical protein